LPIQVGTVGGAVKANPLIPVLLRTMGNPGARKLAGIMAAVGLAQNMAALRALGTVGIQKGHMALHARNVAVSAGATGSAVAAAALRNYLRRGGKRRRGALLIAGHQAAGGRPEAALDASIGVELLHGYLLIHDDFMDQDDVRRGGPTLHRALGGDHLGASLALLCGRLCESWAYQLLGPGAPLAARTVEQVIAGQMADLRGPRVRELSAREIMEVQRAKTGTYTFELPLHLGATLAAAPQALLDALSAYARPL